MSDDPTADMSQADKVKYWTTGYNYWKAALAGKPTQFYENEPCAGFYRLKRNGSWAPIAVWPKRNGLTGASALGFKMGAEVIGSNMGAELWLRYCSNPITEEIYRAVAERGEGWPDADPTVAAILEKPKATRSPGVSNPEADAELERAFIAEDDRRNAEDDRRNAPRQFEGVRQGPVEGPMGNAGGGLPPYTPSVDPTVEFAEQIRTANGGVKAYAKIETDEASVRAAGLRNMLLKLAAEAEKAGKAQYEPHYKEYKRLYELWNPLVEAAKKGAVALRKAMEAHEDDKRAAAKRAADRAREAEEAAARAAATQDAGAEPIKAPPPPLPSNMPPPAQQIRPTYGKAAGVGTRMEVTGIDADKMLAALKPRPEWGLLEQFLMELAQKMANKGIILPGVTAEEKAAIK